VVYRVHRANPRCVRVTLGVGKSCLLSTYRCAFRFIILCWCFSIWTLLLRDVSSYLSATTTATIATAKGNGQVCLSSCNKKKCIIQMAFCFSSPPLLPVCIGIVAYVIYLIYHVSCKNSKTSGYSFRPRSAKAEPPPSTTSFSWTWRCSWQSPVGSFIERKGKERKGRRCAGVSEQSMKVHGKSDVMSGCFCYRLHTTADRQTAQRSECMNVAQMYIYVPPPAAPGTPSARPPSPARLRSASPAPAPPLRRAQAWVRALLLRSSVASWRPEPPPGCRRPLREGRRKSGQKFG
jgi:hypothetical protein